MCKYCETLPNVNFCVSIADTGFDNCAIMYDSNDVAYIGLSYDDFVRSEPISYCPFCGRNLHEEIIFDDDDDDNFTYEQIDVSDVKVGDYIAIDGDSSFCHFSHCEITKIKTKYNEDTGKQYKLLIDEDDYEWNSSTGYCRNGLGAYYIVGFYRKKYAKRN
jgi:hypothetical protein